jgi:hypothetical protein
MRSSLGLKELNKRLSFWKSCQSAGALNASKPIEKPHAHCAGQIKYGLAYFDL